MDKKTKLIIEELRNLISHYPLVKEFNILSKDIKKNDELEKYEEKLKNYQMEMVHSLNNNDDDKYNSILKKYECLKNDYYNNPLHMNYLSLKEEINSFIQEIVEILNNP
ncbi:MAG: YlbF family regulator [Bacilli bacterium]|nr:YlbF family regulator [Bacilli bacterium]